MIRFPVGNAKAIGLSAVAGLAAWKASNFSLDPSHIVEALTASTAGLAVPHNPSSSPVNEADSHIVTPYVNNVEEA
jgi:hypothetical protein